MNEQTRDPERVKADEINGKLVEAFRRISASRAARKVTLLMAFGVAAHAPKRWFL